MSLTTDREDPGLKEVHQNGQQKSYLILSDEERAKGFVRPVRRSYIHIGNAVPKDARLRSLNEEEKANKAYEKYTAFLQYPESESPLLGRYVDKRQEDSILTNGRADGCGGATKMAVELAETYARDPKFYGGTFCVHCKAHFPVAEFVWEGTDLKVGS